uniref:Uncharacterized protein n=1 Tax=Helianthus annuus TaxID=4232 RepID=A0A251VP48_HELAN
MCLAHVGMLVILQKLRSRENSVHSLYFFHSNYKRKFKNNSGYFIFIINQFSVCFILCFISRSSTSFTVFYRNIEKAENVERETRSAIFKRRLWATTATSEKVTAVRVFEQDVNKRRRQ